MRRPGGHWTARRVTGGLGRRIPLRPIRLFFPFRVWQALFRLWLGTVRAQPDRRKAMRELLDVYGDAFYAMDRGAIEYGDGVHPKHRLTRYHDFFVERIRPDERVLDIGSGKGELAHDIAERAGRDGRGHRPRGVGARVRALEVRAPSRDLRPGRRAQLCARRGIRRGRPLERPRARGETCRAPPLSPRASRGEPTPAPGAR